MFLRRRSAGQSVLTVPVPPATPGANDPLNEVVITATRVPEPMDTALESIFIIDRTELADSLAIDVAICCACSPGLISLASAGQGNPNHCSSAAPTAISRSS